MLIYHPAFDAYHCVFRLISLMEVGKCIELDRLRILDFCLCFPAIVGGFELPRKYAKVKRAADEASNVYRTPINVKATFWNLLSTQDSALACLAASGYVDASKLKDKTVEKTSLKISEEILEKCKSLMERESVFFDCLLTPLLQLPLTGPAGLKARSGLLEYKYDAA